eukprot:372694-Hanusia_phi.AAC.1
MCAASGRQDPLLRRAVAVDPEDRRQWGARRRRDDVAISLEQTEKTVELGEGTQVPLSLPCAADETRGALSVPEDGQRLVEPSRHKQQAPIHAHRQCPRSFEPAHRHPAPRRPLLQDLQELERACPFVPAEDDQRVVDHAGGDQPATVS